MNTRLAELISRARDEIRKGGQFALAGNVHAALEPQDVARIEASLIDYAPFLAVADGATFGSVDLWSHSELPSKQYSSADFPGGPSRWVVIGQLLYEPMALNTDNGELRVFVQDGDPNGTLLGTFDSFLESLFSSEYARHVPGGEDDEWWMLLKRLGVRSEATGG